MEWIGGLIERLGPWWAVGALVILVLFDKTGFIPWVMRERLTQNRRGEDRNAKFVAAVQADAEKQRRWRIEDAASHAEEVKRLLAMVLEKDELVAIQIRGNSRIRHALVAALTYAGICRDRLRRSGQAVPPFEEMRTLMDLDPDLADRFNDSLGE